MKLKFIRETEQARLYQNHEGAQMWFPRSVCRRTTKYAPVPGHLPVHDVDVEEWFLEKNPWPAAQRELL